MKYYRKVSKYLMIIGLLLVTSGCDRHEASISPGQAPIIIDKPETSQVNEEDNQVQVTVLEFNEVEEGLDPYLTRMMVSDRYIRIDDGEQSDGYVLFDRFKKRIFSVVDETESILVVDPIYPLQGVPADLQIRSQLQDMNEVPLISGIKPAYYQFHANDTLCYHLVAADGFKPEVTKALQAYQAVLAAQQQETLNSTPKELQTPCFLANYIYAPLIYLSKGFPLEQWDMAGYHRSLSSVKDDVSVSQSLFKLPDDYEYFSIGGGNIKL